MDFTSLIRLKKCRDCNRRGYAACAVTMTCARTGRSFAYGEINNKIIQNKYTPRYTLNQANEAKYEKFLINNLLRYGKNTIRIATNSSNTNYYIIQKVSVE